MSTIQDTDNFLVERNSTQYKVSSSNLMSTIQDTDLMIVARGNDQYKVTCADVKDQLGSSGPPGLVDTSKPWTKYWAQSGAITATQSYGEWYYAKPSNNVFNGYDSDGSGGVPVSQGALAWFLGADQLTGLSSFEFCYENSVNVASDMIIYTAAGTFVNLFSQPDTNGVWGRDPGKHIFTLNEIGGNSFYGFTCASNYGTNDRHDEGSKWVRIEYIKVNGKTLYDPIINAEF